MIECDPPASVEMLNVAFPLLIVPVPSVVLPSLNVTVPVAANGVTVAVKVTELPYVEGFDEEVSVTEEEDFPNATPMKAMQPRMRTRTRDIARIRLLLCILEFLNSVGTDPFNGLFEQRRPPKFLRACKDIAHETSRHTSVDLFR